MMVKALLAKWRYRATLMVLFPVIVGYTVWRAFKDGGRTYALQRFALGIQSLARPLWFHCASVGEVNAVLPLLKLLQKQHPAQTVLVTTNTPTGRDTFIKQAPSNAQHLYLPLDYTFAVRRFLKRIQPSALIVVETELWPHLFLSCFSKQIPVVIINGRLSQRTLAAQNWLKQLYRLSLQEVTAVLARSEDDRQHFMTLGAPAARIKMLGNIKFSGQPLASEEKPARLIEQPYVLVASTHQDEEMQFAQCWKTHQNKKSCQKRLLVVVPRHPERGPAIRSQLAATGITVQCRSESRVVNVGTRLYIADTLGELKTLMQHADLVVMGGSFIPHGGQNLLEPATFGQAIIVGPFMDNFAEETASLLAHKAILQAHSVEEACGQIETLLSHPKTGQQLGVAAQRFMKVRRHIAQQYLDELAQRLSSVGVTFQ
ncbi:MAG: hypothetical protein MJA28_07095 [Gammaproteobacteria bacterium]|nr:hypothetical protein [Gammaproteobacteria bacterium]